MKRSILKGSTVLASGCSMLIAAAGAPAMAQSDGRLLDTIVVTAQKKEENQQDVPVSITAYSGDALAGIGITKTSELGKFIPGLEISSASGEGSQIVVFLRGAGLTDFNTNNAGPIGIYSDEVYISSPVLTSFQFFDTERLEVLKGPQGTLYGRNTTGGAIKFITNKPSDEFEFSARASYAKFETTNIEAAISGPITDRIRARAAISKVDSEGFQENLLNGDKESGVDTFAWRGMVDVDVADNFLVRFNVHGASSEQDTPKYSHLGVLPGGVDVLGYAAPSDPLVGEYNRTDAMRDLDSIGGYVEAKLDFDAFSITSISAYDEVESLFEEETDSSPLELIEADYGVESETFSQELRFDGSFGGVNWLLGGFYLTENLDQNQTIDLFRSLRTLTGGVSDPFGMSTGGAAVLFGRALNQQEAETFAIFGQTDIAITDRLTLTVGGRYTDETRTFTAQGILEDEVLFGPTGLPVYDFQDLRLENDAFSWRFALDYALTDDILAYASATRGFKSGGFNGGFLALDAAQAFIQVQPYDPETLTAYELGVKSDLFDDRLRLNAALFLNNFKGLQVFTLVNTSALPVQVLDNASDAQVIGFEFDALYYPVDNLLISLSAAFLDSELKNFVSNSGADFSGNRIAYTPEASFTGLVRYDHELPNSLGNVYVQSTVAYKSEHFFTTDNRPELSQDGYALVGARVGYDSPSGQWGVAVFGDNLTDQSYFTNATDLSDFGFVNRYVGRPRVFGVEATVNF